MTGFEKENWDFHGFKDGRKAAVHKKYTFIRIDLIQIQKSFNRRPPVWRAQIKSWNLKKTISRSILVEYKRLTKYKIPEIFDKLIKLNSIKEAIFNRLFEGKHGK